MATLDIEGQHVNVDDSFLKLSPEQQDATVSEIASSLKAKPSEGSSLKGIAKSAGVGLAQGALGIASIPGDLADLNMKLAGRNATSGLGSADLQKKVEQYTGDFYKPQGTAEDIASKIGQFAPAAIGGPGSMAARLATRVAAPAFASEAGGAIAGPYGELAGALAGGVGATVAARKFQEMAAARNAAKTIPSAEDLLTSGSNKFEAVKASDAVIKPSSVEQMAKDIKTEMLNEGKHPTSEGQAGVFAALDRLEAMGASGGGVTPKDMEVVRKNLVDLKPNLLAGPTARMATDKFMEKYANLGSSDLLNGSNPFPKLKEAVGDWAAGKRAETIQGKRNLAELNANSPVGMLDSATGGQALQRTMKQLARPMNNTNVPVARKLGFNNQEVSAITEAASGTKMQHAAELMDRLIPAKLGAIPAMVARQIGGLTTKRQVAALDSLVRSRSPLAVHVASQLPPQIVQQMPSKSQRLLQAMILADPSLSQAAQQQRDPVGQSNTY